MRGPAQRALSTEGYVSIQDPWRRHISSHVSSVHRRGGKSGFCESRMEGYHIAKLICILYEPNAVAFFGDILIKNLGGD
jgi:hypothetical protein